MKKRNFLANLLLLSLLVTSTASGGIFSGLSKLGRAAKKVDDVPASTVRHVDNIPTKIDGLSITELKPNSNGSWDVRLPDGKNYDIQSLIANGTDLSEHALVIRAFDLPSDMRALNKLPNELPLYIKNRNGRSFAYIRGDTPRLEYKNLNIPLSNGLTVKTALYHLDKPLSTRKARFLQLTDKSGSPLPVAAYGSNVGVETVSSAQLIDSLKAFKADDLVLSGPIKDGKIFPQGLKGDGVSLEQLKSIAADNDLNLLLLDSKRPTSLLRHLQKKDKDYTNMPHLMPLNTGDLFAAFTDTKKVRTSNSNPFEVSFSQSGRSQVTIQTPKFDEVRESFLSEQITQAVKQSNSSIKAEVFDFLILRTLLNSVRAYQRSQELDGELGITYEPTPAPVLEEQLQEAYTQMSWPERIKTLLMIYPFISLVLGFLVLFPLSRLLERFMPYDPNVQMGFFKERVDSFIRGFLLIVIIMPLLGLPMFIYKLYRIISFPFRVLAR